MHLHLPHWLAAAAGLLSTSDAFTPASTSGTDKLAAAGLVKLAAYTYKNPPKNGCSLKKGYGRQEWSTLSSTQQKAYINAVLCLQSKPGKLPSSEFPGVKSRYDDFVGTHINQTLTIHGTANFLSWHRYFIYTFEQALRNECGYNGYLPYANWGKYAEDLLNAPLFDGSETSISGNGVYRNYSGADIPSAATPYIHLPAGEGGGCVETGPFKNMTVNLGPVVPVFTDVPANPQADGLGYNPRCLRRDIGAYAASIASTDANSTDLIAGYTSIADFQTSMQGDFVDGLLGVHTAGHFWVGGDPGGDIFASPGDPWFWLHHAQIDRTWWIWQNQDLKNRQNAIAGTITLNNSPASRNGTLQDTISLGNYAKDIIIQDAMSTLGSTANSPFCYIYL